MPNGGVRRPAPNDARGGIDVSKRYVLCLTAANRTGILAAVTRALSELGGDIDEISQAVVKNFFAIILAADFPDHRDEHVIVGHLEGICRQFGASVFLHDPERETEMGEALEAGEKHILTLTGGDAPGIVATISGRLAARGNRHQRSARCAAGRRQIVCPAARAGNPRARRSGAAAGRPRAPGRRTRFIGATRPRGRFGLDNLWLKACCPC